MRKTRVDESSKNSSTAVRASTRIKSQSVSKTETTECKKKIEKNATGDKTSRTAAKTSNTAAKAANGVTRKSGSGELDNQTGATVKTQSKTPATTRSSGPSTLKVPKASAENAVAGARTRHERKADGEKRGISTIYMPKAHNVRSTRTSGAGDSRRDPPSPTRSKDTADAKATSTRAKDAAKAALTRSRDNTVKATSSRTKVNALKAASSRSKIDAVSPASTKTKDNSNKAASDRTREASVKSKDQYTTRQRLPSRERRRSRTLSPSEVKVLRSDKRDSNSSSSTVIPVTRDGEAGASKIDTDEEEYEYEDDFESYESDFEECTGSVSEASEASNKSGEVPEVEPIEMRTEKQKTTINSVDSRKCDEERMLDSGHYDLAEARRRAARVESVTMPRETRTSGTEIIVQPSISPYREERSGENKSLPSSMDEGFEDARSGDFAKSPPLSRITFIDFRKPAMDLKTAVSESSPPRPPPPKIVSRGEKLLEMIKLDVVEWSIHESKPVAYEEYIRTYGKFNTRQVCIQTNEDNLDVETQTEAIECTSKWTQFPAKCRTVLKNEDDVKLFNMERLGVGSEYNEDSPNVESRPTYDVLQLNEFLSQAGKVMLSLLEERGSGNNTSNDSVHEFPFSESIIKLSIDTVTFLSGRPVTIIHYSNVSNRILLTIHAPVDEDIETTRDEDFVTDCSIGCVWNILQPSRPIKLFYSPSAITACCFHSMSYNVVLAGLEDGSISLWDLAEEETWHRKIVDEANKSEWCVRSPTYSSIGHFDESGHSAEIISLRVLSKIEGDTADAARNKFMPIQICSLDADGRLIIWSVLRNMSRTNVDDLGLSWWGDLRLVKSQEISLYPKKTSERKNHLKGFSDMHVDRIDTNALYIATNTTNILHATRIGKHATPPAYKSSEMDWCGDTKCIEGCPFDQPYFLVVRYKRREVLIADLLDAAASSHLLIERSIETGNRDGYPFSKNVGCADGTVRLHSTTAEKPLLQLKNEECNATIKTVQWSRSKPLTIYVLDVDSKIHVWNLGNSDMFPAYTISMEKWAHVSSIQLSPCRTTHEMSDQYMALAMDNGSVEVHRLKEQFYYAQKDAVKREMNTFLRYVAIL